MATQSLEGRKVALFLGLVIVGLACLGALVYSLFLAKPHTDPQMQKSSHSLLRRSGSSIRV